jgi:2-methylcitrate dehydratase PrpD
MGQQIESLARFVAQTQWDEVPEPVQHHTKLVVLDTLGVILAGSERPEVRQARDVLATTGGGATIYARGCSKTDPRTAALLNGVAGRAVEMQRQHFQRSRHRSTRG